MGRLTYLTDAFEALHIFDRIDSYFFAFIRTRLPSSHCEKKENKSIKINAISLPNRILYISIVHS